MPVLFPMERALAITIYGISNCDTVKRAKAWFDARSVDYAFHDYKKRGVPEDRLRAWADAVGWEQVLNRRGTTFRALDVTDREILDSDHAVRMMLDHPSLIKRPVIETATAGPIVGFDPDAWTQII